MLESVRLWPTTPAILRELTADITMSGVQFGAGSSVLIAVPAFHRDPDLLPFANEFAPDIWLDRRAEQYPQLVPFSAGPAECPGRNLVLFVTSTVLANLLAQLQPRIGVGSSAGFEPSAAGHIQSIRRAPSCLRTCFDAK